MGRAVYALLVGIDKYPAPVTPLRGCVNDIHRFQTFLQERVSKAGDQLSVLSLADDQAKRDAIIDGFRKHLGNAKKDDVALFYYSGHGSQAASPPEFWHLEPDHLDETLVCWDSRLTSITNRPTDTADRYIPGDTCSGSGFSSRSAQRGNWYTLPHGRHILLAACSPEEEAKELFLNGEQRGAFSYYLVDTLQRTGIALTYRDAFKRVNALVRSRVSAQSPQMEATNIPDLDQPFLGGAISDGLPYFTVSEDKHRGWVIDGGAVHGIPNSTDSETTNLAVFPVEASIEQFASISNAIGTARVQQVFPAQSTIVVTLSDGSGPQSSATYKAIVTALPLPPMIVKFTGEKAGLMLVRQALAKASPNGEPSLLVREGITPDADLVLLAEENRYRIRRRGDGYVLVVDTPEFTQQSAQLVVQRLEHIAQWRKVLELGNPTSGIGASLEKVDVSLGSDEAEFGVFKNTCRQCGPRYSIHSHCWKYFH